MSSRAKLLIAVSLQVLTVTAFAEEPDGYYEYRYNPDNKSNFPWERVYVEAKGRRPFLRPVQPPPPNRPVPREEAPRPQARPEERKEIVKKPTKVMALPYRTTPSTLTSVDWAANAKELSDKEREALITVLERAGNVVWDWQDDIFTRFSLCPIDLAEAEEKGILEKLPWPYVIAIGRLHILRTSLVNLETRMSVKNESMETITPGLKRVQKRMADLGTLLETTSKKAKKNYRPQVGESLKELGHYYEKYKKFDDAGYEAWVVYWQLVVEDIEIWRENYQNIRKNLQGRLGNAASEADRRLGDVSREVGERPWEYSYEVQLSLFEEIERAVGAIEKDYNLLGGAAEWNLGKYPLYDQFQDFSGANENLVQAARSMGAGLRTAINNSRKKG